MSALLYHCVAALLLAWFACGQESSTFSEKSSWEPCKCERGPCLCVVYYLCGRDGVIITTGDNIVDERFGGVLETCPGVQICCRNPVDNSTKPSTSTTESSQPPPPPISPPTEPPPPTKTGCGVRGTAFQSDQKWASVSSDEGTTAFAEYPWMLALLRTDDSNIDVFLCGASLINQRVALTAAHCVQKWTAKDLVVRAGEWNTTSTDEPIAHQDRFVSNIILHPDFTKGSLFNDIALLVLDDPFQDATNVGVVCLPESGAIFDSQRCLATGWGRDTFGNDGRMRTTLRKVDLPIIDSVSCQERLRTTRLGIFFLLDKSFICAGGEPDKDTCQGDGGGPLMCQSQVDPDRYIQVGIVSWGIGCKDSRAPAVYANVALLRNWVDSELSLLGVESSVSQP